MHVGELGVGYGGDGSIDPPNASGAQANLLDGADAQPAGGGILAIAAKVTDPNRTVGIEIEGAQEVLQGTSRRQSDGQAAHTRAGNQAIDRNSDFVRNPEHEREYRENTDRARGVPCPG